MPLKFNDTTYLNNNDIQKEKQNNDISNAIKLTDCDINNNNSNITLW